MTNYYAILGVHQDASDAEIKAAFKRNAVLYHPDKNEGDMESEEMFKLVNAAYQTLSNPYERARYDLKLKFGTPTVTEAPPTYYRPPVYRPRGGKIDHKTNDRATFWAFSISLGIAVVVMTVMEIYNMYQEHQYNMMLEERRLVFEEAKDHRASGDVTASLVLMESLGIFHDEEVDMKTFQEDVLDDLLQSGTRSFYQKNYEEAVKHFEIFDEFAFNKRLSFELLYAESHMNAGNYDQAIGRYNSIIISGNNTIENNLKVAWIYREGKKDYDQAMNYYDIAGKMAINGYKAVFGEAYPLLISARNVPPSHFEVFHGMAQTLFYMENYERALRALKWNVAMWPDNPENYYLKGSIYMARGERSKACEEFNQAVAKGWDHGTPCD